MSSRHRLFCYNCWCLLMQRALSRPKGRFQFTWVTAQCVLDEVSLGYSSVFQVISVAMSNVTRTILCPSEAFFHHLLSDGVLSIPFFTNHRPSESHL